VNNQFTKNMKAAPGNPNRTEIKGCRILYCLVEPQKLDKGSPQRTRWGAAAIIPERLP